MIPHIYEIYRIGKLIELERLEITKDCREGGMGIYCLVVTELLFRVMEIFGNR